MVKAIIFLYEPDLSSLPSLSVPGSVATTWITWLADQEKYIGYFLLARLSLSLNTDLRSLTVERVKPI